MKHYCFYKNKLIIIRFGRMCRYHQTMEKMTSIAHLRRLGELLKSEYDAEVNAYGRALDASHISGRVSESYCHYPITLGNTSRNAMDQLIISLSYEADPDETDNEFEPGRPVQFFHLSSEGNAVVELPYSCFVEQVGDGILQVSLPSVAALKSITDRSERYLLGIHTGIDATSYRVMLQALADAERSDNEHFIQLREVLIGTREPRFRQLPAVRFPWLNDSQNHAVQQVVEAQDVAIVHGPPGTGKTTTLIEAIIETLQRETQVLVCAPSNAAVDWISEQLMRRSTHVLRIGNPLRISDEMLECSYERRYAAHPDYPELWKIRQLLRNGNTSNKNQIRHLHQRQTELEIKINEELFREARVVACTLIGSAYHIMERRHFSTLFIDEAAQALEPACWAAILKADRVVLGGDHQQLPPTVKSVEAARGGLAETLMQHVVKTKPRCVTLLTTQYRMHQDIMAFPSRWFYHGQLQAAPAVADRLVTLMDIPLTWIDTCRCQFGERQSNNMSRSNAEEARLVVHTLRDYIDTIGLQRILDDRVDFGIISPYRAQVRMIRRLLKMQRFFRQLRGQVSVGSVDGFQGQERDVIIISMVRDNAEGNIGFLRDLRRMNVAITRARMKLIVIGNSETLTKHHFYNALFEHFQQRGVVVCPDMDLKPNSV